MNIAETNKKELFFIYNNVIRKQSNNKSGKRENCKIQRNSNTNLFSLIKMRKKP